MKNILLLIIVLIYSTILSGQDTISIYFGSNKHLLTKPHKTSIDIIAATFNNSEIDSIIIIGFADSVGDFILNKQLSLKRANSVKKYCFTFIDDKNKLRISAKGESTNNTQEKSRRVDILIFTKIENEQIDWKKVSENTSPCFTIAYDIIDRSHLTEIKKSNRKYVQLENSLPDSLLKKRVYSGTLNNGEFTYRRIRWKNKITGKLWWKKWRSVALIKKKDFENYKIFYVTEMPCDSCNQEFEENLTIKNEEQCTRIETELMRNSKYKSNPFNGHNIKVKTPKEYVNIENSYFESCNIQKSVKWKTKRGFGRDNYYFTAVSRNNYYVPNISSIKECCDSNSYYDCSKSLIRMIPCETNRTGLVGLRLKSSLWLEESNFFSLTGLSYLFARNQSVIEFNGFYFANKQAMISSSFEYALYSLPGKFWKPFSWSNDQYYVSNNYYFDLIIGTEVQSIFNPTEDLQFAQELYFGITFQSLYPQRLFPRFFLYSGIRNNYSLQNTSPNSFVKFGLSFRLF